MSLVVNVAVLQMSSTHDLEENFQKIEQGLKDAKAKACDCLVLPEDCLTLGMDPTQKLNLANKYKKVMERLGSMASKAKSWLIAGSIPVVFDKTRYYSTCFVFDDRGCVVSQYEKIHLFDVAVSDSVSFKESETVMAGEKTQVVQTPFGAIGLSICYDVRFPALYQTLSQLGANVLVVPSAFTPQTGKAHWELLLRARAVENLCYVLAPNQYGLRHSGESTYGHSCIISPWGDVLSLLEHGEGVITASLDFEYLEKLRSDFPVLKHRQS